MERRAHDPQNPNGDLPVIHKSAFVDPTAIICGKVLIGEKVFIGPDIVIRANDVDDSGDMEPIIIGTNSNIQDGVVIHSTPVRVQIGWHTSIAHRSIVHGRACAGALIRLRRVPFIHATGIYACGPQPSYT